MKPQIVFVIGPTCAGKSTFMDTMRKYDHVGLVEVGKMMRAKYPPSYFAGQANPSHTEAEAWQMMKDEITRNLKKDVIFVDGQPRDVKQVDGIDQFIGLHKVMFIHLYASKSERLKRLNKRFEIGSEAYDLGAKRIEGPTCDDIKLYSVLSELLTRGCSIFSYNTGSPNYNPETAFKVE